MQVWDESDSSDDDVSSDDESTMSHDDDDDVSDSDDSSEEDEEGLNSFARHESVRDAGARCRCDGNRRDSDGETSRESERLLQSLQGLLARQG